MNLQITNQFAIPLVMIKIIASPRLVEISSKSVYTVQIFNLEIRKNACPH